MKEGGLPGFMEQSFITWLRRKIEEKGLSERAVSMYAGLSPGTIWYILNHPDSTPNPGTCRKLAAYFDADPDYVLALAGHRELKPVWEDDLDFPPDIVELMQVVNDLPPDLRAEAMRIIERVVEGLEEVQRKYSAELEEALEKAGKAA